MKLNPRASALALCLLASAAVHDRPAHADGATCAAEDKIDKFARQRRATLALLGRVPTAQEIDALAGTDFGDADVDRMLRSQDFVLNMQDYMARDFYPNNPNLNLVTYTAILTPSSDSMDPMDPALWREARTQFLSDVTLPTSTVAIEAYLCVDQPSPPYNGVGEPPVIGTNTVQGYRQPVYGWIRKAVYWSPTLVKLCANEAREDAVSPSGDACNSALGTSSIGCGCGPNGSFCSTYANEARALSGLRSELDWAVKSMLDNDLSYLTFLKRPETSLNGALAYILRNQTQLLDTMTLTSPVANAQLDAVPYDSPGTVVTRDPFFGGLFGTILYTTRFQTDRSRVKNLRRILDNYYYTAPAMDLSVVPPDPNLRTRQGCNYCHTDLDSKRNAFGRIVESGGGPLDTTRFPPFRQDCYDCALANFMAGSADNCSDECVLVYYTGIDGTYDQVQPYWGKYKTLAFNGDPERALFDGGPTALVDLSVSNGSLAKATVERMFQRMMNRDPGNQDRPWVDQLIARFQSNFMIRDLVRAIATNPAFWRAP
jgi:hypothetical protein